jgi:putative endonuclease
MFFTYILLCSDDSFYIGYTNNLKRRLGEHNNKKGSFYLRSKLPVKLIYFEKYSKELEAQKREKQLKGWSRIKKINLIKFGHPKGPPVFK